MSVSPAPVTTTPTPTEGSSKPSYRSKTPKWLRFLITFWVAIVILCGFVVAFTLQCLATVLFGLFYSRTALNNVRGVIFRTVMTCSTVCNPFWSFTNHTANKITTLLADEKKRPHKVIVMCNHVSNLDPFITSRALLPFETKYIAKSDLFKVPFGGWAMSLGGDIPVYFTAEKGGWGTAKGTVGKMMAHCKELLVDHDVAIMVYPEGARSGSMEMREFKQGMFMLAHEIGATILPMALNNTHIAWPKSSTLFDFADIHCVVGEPMALKPTMEETITAVRAEIQRLINTLPNTKQ